MNDLGVFKTDSTILLELLIKDEQNQVIATDFPPTATIEEYGSNGFYERDNVTLEIIEDLSIYRSWYQIPRTWPEGKYKITYTVEMAAKQYQTSETFTIGSTSLIIEETNALIDRPPTYPTLEPQPVEEVVPETSGYLPPSEFQIPTKVEVDDRRLIITLTDALVYNHTYQVVFSSDIHSMNQTSLSSPKTLTFTSEYNPLLATPLEVQSITKGVYRYFEPSDVYAAIRDAGQKAFQLLGRVPDANNRRYRVYAERETTYFPATKYIGYEAARSLLASLMIRILQGKGPTTEEEGLLDQGLVGAITLGDFSFTAAANADSQIKTEDEETQLKKLQALLAQVEKDTKFWQDSMMGQNRRGYAKPSSGSFRTAGGSPEGRDF